MSRTLQIIIGVLMVLLSPVWWFVFDMWLRDKYDGRSMVLDWFLCLAGWIGGFLLLSFGLWMIWPSL
jgi:hypothetical protein